MPENCGHANSVCACLACPAPATPSPMCLGSWWGMKRSARTRIRSEEHTSELQSLMRISYAVFCLKKKKVKIHNTALNNVHQLTRRPLINTNRLTYTHT